MANGNGVAAGQSASLSGSIVDETGAPLEAARIIAFLCSNPLIQERAMTDSNGNYELDVVPGVHDLVIDADQHGVALRGGIRVEKTTRIGAQLEPFDAHPANNLSGQLTDTKGASLSDWVVSVGHARPSSRSGKPPPEARTDGDGRFQLAIDAETLLVVNCVHPDGAHSEAVLVPKPNKPVTMMVCIDQDHSRDNAPLLEALVRRPEGDVLAGPPFSVPFTVNNLGRVGSEYVYKLYDGLMYATSLVEKIEYLSVTGEARSSLYIWAAHYAVPVPYAWTIYVDNFPHTNKSMVPPSGTYWFTDQSQDRYYLWVYLPHLHTVGYNSSSPSVNAIDIAADSRIW